MSETNTIDILGEDVAVAKIIDKSITGFVDNDIKLIGANAFYACENLVTVNFPAATEISHHAFALCKTLSSVSIPSAISIGASAFASCSALTTLRLPVVAFIDTYAFYLSGLKTLILENTSQIATLNNTSAFQYANKAIIYVPDALVDSYKSATNWSTYADRIKGISELPA